MISMNSMPTDSMSRTIFGNNGDATCGAFRLPSPIDGQPLQIIASSDDGWDHVSVSRQSRTPNWPEMSFIKHRFFEDEECVIEFHVPKSEHINHHPHCLHLWRKHGYEFPRPPSIMVGPEKK